MYRTMPIGIRSNMYGVASSHHSTDRAVGLKPGTFVVLREMTRSQCAEEWTKDAKLAGLHLICSPLYALCFAQGLAFSKCLCID